MCDAFNEEHLPGKSKGRNRNTGKRKPASPHPDTFIINTFWGLACLERQAEQFLGRAGFLLQESAGSFTGMP